MEAGIARTEPRSDLVSGALIGGEGLGAVERIDGLRSGARTIPRLIARHRNAANRG